jgi:hypothetical protein
MPYVKQERRPALDKVVDELVKADIKPGDLELFLLNLAHNSYKFILAHRISNALFEAHEADVKPNGDINYILFKYCKYHVKPSYNNYKAFMGEIYNAMDITKSNYMPEQNYRNEFRESAEWIRIKILTPYEEKAIERNGDV